MLLSLASLLIILFLADGRTINVHALRLLQSCNNDDPLGFCQDQGGPGAIARPGQSCYDSFQIDCLCRSNYEQTEDGCCHEDGDEFCFEQGGAGAIPRQGQSCYNSFQVDCLCDGNYEKTDDECVEKEVQCLDDDDRRVLFDPDEWCKDEARFGNDFAHAKDEITCFDDFGEHCLCRCGLKNVDGGCDEDGGGCLQPEDPNEWCKCEAREGKEAATAKTDGQDGCFDDFKKDCTCFGLAEFELNDDGDGCVAGAPPTQNPTPEPTPFPTLSPTFRPTLDPTKGPTPEPTPVPTPSPTVSPTLDPTREPTSTPPLTKSPTGEPTRSPTTLPLPSNPTSPSTTPSGGFGFLLPNSTPSPAHTQSSPQGPTPVNSPGSVFGFLIESLQSSSTSTPVTYRMDYVGRFQKISEAGCSFQNPQVEVGCIRGKLSISNASDPTIVCGPSNGLPDGSNRIVCNNTCNGDSCQQVFVGTSFASDFGNASHFGEIYFSCEGEAILDLKGWFNVSAGGWGSCGGPTTRDGSGAATFHTGQMGIRCSNSYSFDDSFYECNMESSSISLGGDYACSTGSACSEEDCTFYVDEVTVSTDVFAIAPECVTAVGGTSGAAPTSLPEMPSMSNITVPGEGKLTALFEVHSGYFNGQTECRMEPSTLRATCLGSNISLVENQNGLTCSEVDQSTIACNVASNSVATNAMTKALMYECSSTDHIPPTKVTIDAGAFSCNSESQVEASRQLQLGVLCGDGSVLYDDFFYECGAHSHLVNNARFTCSSLIVNTSVNGADVSGSISTVEIGTDIRWGLRGLDLCLGLDDSAVAGSSAVVEKSLTKGETPLGPAKTPAFSAGEISSSCRRGVVLPVGIFLVSALHTVMLFS